jgi:hypothetical protein
MVFFAAARWLRLGGRLALSLAGWRTNGFLLLQLGDGELTGAVSAGRAGCG